MANTKYMRRNERLDRLAFQLGEMAADADKAGLPVAASDLRKARVWVENASGVYASKSSE